MTSPLERLSPSAIRATMIRYRDAVAANQHGLNRLNVYPVPDGDTGTNMARTLDAVVDELAGSPGDDAETVCHAISHGSLMGARGNSGVILSQILRGLSDVFRHREVLSGHAVAEAFGSAAKAAYASVLKPIEGTILTVVREVAEAARIAADEGLSLVGVLEAARAAGRIALDKTPDLLPVLKDAGVVDAGGAGFLLLLDAVLHIVDGRPLPEADLIADDVAVREVALHHRPRHGQLDEADPGEGPSSVADLRYEVMFFLDLIDDRLDAFKQSWASLGDSIVVVGGDGLYNCHVHTDDIGGAIEAPIELGGRPHKIRVTDLFEEVAVEHAAREAAISAAPMNPTAVGVVAVAAGSGVVALFNSLGVQRVVSGGQTMNPSTAELLAAVEAINADQIIILPNNSNIIPVARRVDELTTKTVFVVPTCTVPEALAALVSYDPDGDGSRVADAMIANLATVRSGEITQAVRDANSPSGPVHAGDWIGLVRGDGIVSVGRTMIEAVHGLLEELIDDDAELITIIEGDGAASGVTERIRSWLSTHAPQAEIEVHAGGQPLYPYLLGVE